MRGSGKNINKKKKKKKKKKKNRCGLLCSWLVVLVVVCGCAVAFVRGAGKIVSNWYAPLALHIGVGHNHINWGEEIAPVILDASNAFIRLLYTHGPIIICDMRNADLGIDFFDRFPKSPNGQMLLRFTRPPNGAELMA